jgi:hypothetical protein
MHSLWPVIVKESVNPTFQNDDEGGQCEQAKKIEGAHDALEPPIVSVVLTVRPNGSSEISGRPENPPRGKRTNYKEYLDRGHHFERRFFHRVTPGHRTIVNDCKPEGI